MIRYRLCRWLWCSDDSERNWSLPTAWKCCRKGNSRKCKWIIEINKHWQTGACFLAADTSECRVPHKDLWHDNIFVYKVCWPCLLNPCSRVVLEELTNSQLVKKFPAMYGEQRFITVITSARHLSLPGARSNQSMPPSHFLKIHFHIICSSTPTSSKWFLSLRFPQNKPLCHSRLPHKCYMTRPFHSFRFDYSTNIWWEIKIMKLLIL